ncbi:hypothetical protein Droror1_Dr00027719 [Drosera rotundifolia]
MPMATSFVHLPSILLRKQAKQLGLRNHPLASRFVCSSSSEEKKLVMYSKPGCCLCDGLKEKLSAAFSLDGPLNGVQLEMRDITTNPEWERAYQYEIPVLAKVRSDGTEEELPRVSPRIGVEMLHKKISEGLGL